MSGLSNLFRPRDAPKTTVRPVGPGEIAVALSVLLGNAERIADGGAVADFEELARLRGIDLTRIQIGLLDGRLAAAALPVPSPGGTVLMLLSPAGRSAVAAGLVAKCAESVIAGLATADRPLVQVLLEPGETKAADALRAVGVAPLAILLYLQRRLKRVAFPAAALPPFVHYSEATHERFARAIEATYENSLDCPPMRGLRGIDDVVAGHRATGEFDPTLWYCFHDDAGRDLGVLLLAPVTAQPMTELVYLGLAPAARGKRLADELVRHALHRAAGHGHELLTLAVDSGNVPALRLYHRHGLSEIARRLALIRPPVAP